MNNIGSTAAYAQYTVDGGTWNCAVGDWFYVQAYQSRVPQWIWSLAR